MINLYIANLGKYNEGELKGEWLTLPVTEEELEVFLAEQVGINAEYEEYAIHDYETDIPELEIGEYDSITELSELETLYCSLQKYEQETVAAIVEWGFFSTGTTALRQAIDEVEDFNLMTDVNSHEDYGYYLVDEGLIGEIPESLKGYLDYEAIGRDNSFGDCYYSNKGLVTRN
jgi:antirestriction protein